MDLSSLNKEQLESVISKEKYLRIVAGAGSGKTRVLTYRIAHLIQNEFVHPRNIMAVTFTNKAAKEIKDRVTNLVGEARGLFLGTIHSWCARFLRFEARYIDYPDNFTIIDEEDYALEESFVPEDEGGENEELITNITPEFIENGIE